MARFDYTIVDGELDILVPRLEMNLSLSNISIAVTGLVDSGAEVNILPYSIGCSLGAQWCKQPKGLPITQGSERIETCSLFVKFAHPQITQLSGSVKLYFAWAKSDCVQLLLGQNNFFKEFDVCFFRSKGCFEIRTLGECS